MINAVGGAVNGRTGGKTKRTNESVKSERKKLNLLRVVFETRLKVTIEVLRNELIKMKCITLLISIRQNIFRGVTASEPSHFEP